MSDAVPLLQRVCPFFVMSYKKIALPYAGLRSSFYAVVFSACCGLCASVVLLPVLNRICTVML